MGLFYKMVYDGKVYFGTSATGSISNYMQFGNTFTISYTVNNASYPSSSFPNVWFNLSTLNGSGNVNICGGGNSTSESSYNYNGGNASYNTNTNIMSVTFNLPPSGFTLTENYGTSFTLQPGDYTIIPYCATGDYSSVLQMDAIQVTLGNYPISTSQPQFVTIKNGTLYAACSDGIRLYNVDTGVYIKTIPTSFAPVGLVVANGTLYTTSDSNTLCSYNLTNNLEKVLLNGSLNHPQEILYYNNRFYIANFSSNQVLLYNTIGMLNATFNNISSPVGMYIDSASNTLYVASYNTMSVGSYNATTGAPINGSIATFESQPYGVAYSGNYLYVALYNSNKIVKCDATTGAKTTFSTTGSLPYGLTVSNNYLYSAENASNVLVRYVLPPVIAPPVIACFKEGSRILTSEGYISVQNLRKGDLVKTSKHGFVPIHSIGKRRIQHFALEERIKDQLYKCSTDKYPELFEDLVITGCHSILVDKFTSDEQRENTIKINRKLYVTDGKYRLPACADEKASVYDKSGYYNIYHFALENDDYYMNYGVYANGLLVETCSKRYLNELSNMELL